MNQQPVKINLGCGPVGKDDWINIDWGILAILHKFSILGKFLRYLKLFPRGYNVSWPKNILLHNCKNKLPFADGTVDYVYSSHFLEHFKKYEAIKVLKDCRRILKPGGVLRIVVPDLELIAKKYLEKDLAYFKRLTVLFNSNPNEEVIPSDVLVQCFFPDFNKDEPRGVNRVLKLFMKPHCWMYDSESLGTLLKQAGFKHVVRQSYRQGRVPDLESLDVLPETSLYVEGEK